MDVRSDEQEIWTSFLEGDEEAYTRLYRLHIKAMYRYGMTLVPVSEAFVLDCIQDVFTELWIKRERLSTPDNVRHYLLKALKNRILHLLKRKEKPSEPIHRNDFEEFWPEPSAEEIMMEQETSENREALVRNLLARLPHRQQEAVRLRFVEGLDYGEIAEMLTVNRQSAQNLVFRAVENLRDWITRQGRPKP